MDVSVDKTGAYYPASDIDLFPAFVFADTGNITVLLGPQQNVLSAALALVLYRNTFKQNSRKRA